VRILITGISGQVGGALLSRVRNHDLIAADRSMLDLSRPEQIFEILDRLAPEAIVNPAAYTAVDGAEGDRDLAHTVNAVAPAEIARWAALRHVPHVHFSTDYVFHGSGNRPWRENDRTDPLSVYGATKLAGENAIRATGGDYIIVRTSWVYSAVGNNFLRTIASRAGAQKELRVVSDQIGAPTSANLITTIVAKIIGDNVDTLRASCARAGGLVHLSASGETSWHGFAVAIINGLRARGVPLAVEQVHPIQSDEYPTRAKRPLNSRLDLTRLRDVFGITPRSWDDALTDELALLIDLYGRS
jgi:dTDP-4-dehydrorhamnose reductase